MKAEFPQALYAPSWQTRDFSSLNHHLEAQYRGMNSLSLSLHSCRSTEGSYLLCSTILWESNPQFLPQHRK